MTTPAQIAANRINSQLSTGPTSEAGKAVASRNSFKHGLYSKQLVVPGEDPAELDALRAELIAEHQPVGETEAILVNEMAEQFWRLRRARGFEAKLLQGEFHLPHMTAVQRMMSSAERGFYKALNTLRELQKARGFVPQKYLAAPDVGARHASPAADIGFVQQNSEIGATSAATGGLNGFVPQAGLDVSDVGARHTSPGNGFVPHSEPRVRKRQ